jgi:hypothetical protein
LRDGALGNGRRIFEEAGVVSTGLSVSVTTRVRESSADLVR